MHFRLHGFVASAIFGKLNASMNVRTKYRRLVLCGLVLAAWNMGQAQTLGQAKAWFTQGEFAKAKPVFAKAVRQRPGDATYNFWYGACLYETGEKDAAQPYLERSAKRQVINAYRYLGLLYADQYRFDEAISNMEEHIGWLDKKHRPTDTAETELEVIRKKARMMRGVEKVVVLDSLVVDKDNLTESYRLSSETGILGHDANDAGTSYMNERKNKMIFSHSDGSHQQLYSSIRLTGNDWSTPERLDGLDEEANLNYPFVQADGVTLYFAADGDNSIGGYDLFVTRFDAETHTYLKPSNMGMPFSSPYNDYLYVIDEKNNVGWFASDRFQPEGKVCIYIFRPNAIKEVYDYDETHADLLRCLASLRSISATQMQDGQAVMSLEKLTATTDAVAVDDEHDFTFVIDDSHIYHSQSEFQSGKALDAFREWQQKTKEERVNLHLLNDKRTAYIRASAAEKVQLTQEILSMEQAETDLRMQIRQLEVQARNEELRLVGAGANDADR